jgi:hypothetical protein
MDQFKSYSLEFLESAANYAGYQKERLLNFYNNEICTKKKRL